MRGDKEMLAFEQVADLLDRCFVYLLLSGCVRHADYLIGQAGFQGPVEIFGQVVGQVLRNGIAHESAIISSDDVLVQGKDVAVLIKVIDVHDHFVIGDRIFQVIKHDVSQVADLIFSEFTISAESQVVLWF